MDTQLPAGDGDGGEIKLEVIAKNKFGKSKPVRTKAKSEAKQFNVSDFVEIATKMANLDKENSLSFAQAVLSSAKVIFHVLFGIRNHYIQYSRWW